MKYLFGDFESKSLLDVQEVGTHKYVTDPSTVPLIFSWAPDHEKTNLWDCRHAMPPRLLTALRDPTVIKLAYNVPFEYGILKHKFGIEVPYEQWIDIMVLCRYMSIPGTLGSVCRILELPEDKAKIKDGKELIHFFCEPSDRGGKNTLFGVTEPYFREPERHPLEWQRFCEYCIRDTDTERTIFRMFEPFMYPPSEQKAWCMSERINDRGVPVNVPLVQIALKMAETSKDRIVKLLKNLTNLENPNAPQQLLPWLADRGYPYKSLNKVWVQRALKENIPAECKRALVYRQESSKTSYKKFETILKHVSPDGRIRGLFAFMGAPRTGRFSGHGVQFQNIPRPTKIVEKNLETILAMIAAGDETGIIEKFVPKNEYIREVVPSAIGIITSCIRSVFQAPVDP